MTTKSNWACFALVCGAMACSSEGSSPPGGSGDPAELGGAGGANAGGSAAGLGSGGVIGGGGYVGMSGTPGSGGMPMGGMPGSGGDLGMAGMGGMTGMGGGGAGGVGAGGDGAAGMGAGGDGAGGDGAGGSGGGDGTCCSDGDCLCHGDAPSTLPSGDGPFTTDSYDLRTAGCIYYPTNAEPPFAAVAISDGYLGSGGCGIAQTGRWGPLYASWGIVTMIIHTSGGDQPPTRGTKLTAGIAAFKAENENSSSPLYQKLAGRYGTAGFSMGGGGTTYSAANDPSLLTSIPIMPWGPTRSAVTVPSLVICGASDGIAPCGSHGTPFYGRLGADVPKMRITVSGGHSGQPSAGGGQSGRVGLAFQKVFLEGDERWRPLLAGVDSNDTNIQ